ncbi:hypothetical protein [Neisseria meningitidis]|uniref:hypothetical protein n=1 Tax=Neisseria meningitidis TaxID=487 RepID=UPI001E37B344|nr:hypothetical protein [Neisseria meningitidis]
MSANTCRKQRFPFSDVLAGCCKQRRFAFLMAVVFLDERPNTQEWIGLGLVTAGVLTLALKR